MRIEGIEFFLTLAETLNYSEAAARLYITQSALSRTIQQMEQELGVKLFYRSHRSVQLTPAGKSFLYDCSDLIAKYHASVERAHNAYRGEAGRITMGIHNASVNPVMFDIMNSCSREFPNIAIDLVSLSTSRLIFGLDEGSLDVALTAGVPQNPSIEKIPLAKYEDCLVVSKGHPLAKEDVVSVKKLKNESFAVMNRKFSSRGFDMVYGISRKAGFLPRIEVMAENVPHLMALVASGNYVTFLSGNYSYMTFDRLAFVPLKEQNISYLYLEWNLENVNPCVSTITNFIRSRFLLK